MSEVVINVGKVGVEEIDRIVDTVKKLIVFGKGIAAFTPTSLDNEVLDRADQLVDWAASLAKMDGILFLINFIADLLKKGHTQEEVVAALSEKFATDVA